MRHLVKWIRSRIHREQPRDSGFVLVWFALMLIVLLAVAALAVDLGHAYFAQQQAQNAADAAALSGVVHLTDLDPQQVQAAKDEAVLVADKNISHDGTVTVTPNVKSDPGFSALRPNQLAVTVTHDIDTFFARAIGFNRLTVHGTGVAEYDPPVNLGSPWSNFGTAPDCAGCFAANMSANISAQYDDKGNGDALTMTWCQQQADNCPHGGLNNEDRDTSGELFQLENQGGGALAIHLFDPAWIDTHDKCENDALFGVGVDNSYFSPSVWGPDWLANHPDPWHQPETAVPPSQYCTGDNTAGTNFLHYNATANPNAGADQGNSVYQDPRHRDEHRVLVVRAHGPARSVGRPIRVRVHVQGLLGAGEHAAHPGRSRAVVPPVGQLHDARGLPGAHGASVPAPGANGSGHCEHDAGRHRRPGRDGRQQQLLRRGVSRMCRRGPDERRASRGVGDHQDVAVLARGRQPAELLSRACPGLGRRPDTHRRVLRHRRRQLRQR
jgi:hypothetical protein